MGSVEVVILGQRYTIRGDANEEYIRRLAEFVDTRMKEVLAAAPGTSPLKAAILASLDIADELHRMKAPLETMTSEIEEKTRVLTGLFD